MSVTLLSAKGSSSSPEQMSGALIDWLASVSNDPYAYVLGAFPWSEPGSSIQDFEGPNEWQTKVLTDIRDGLITATEAIRIARSSGHGIGKTALVCWIIKWGCDTLPDTRGVVTANTENQLKTKTWSELGKWHNLSITREYFTLTATAYFSKDPSRERTWRIDAVPWSEKNTEAFAGLHNQGKRIILIMDEASAILDLIWEVAEGAMTDSNTQIIWAVFGNPTRSIGRFKECFPGGRFAGMWNSASIDSRSVPFTNKALFDGWIEAYGEDSDFVRIRVKGQFPRTGEMEFISAADVEAAMTREVTTALSDPLALGVDVARYGAAESVIAIRKGRDARSIPWRHYRGLSTVELAQRVYEVHSDLHSDGIFVDGGGVGGGVVDNIRAQHLFCYEVQFGGKDDTDGAVWGIDGERYANKRAAMWGALRAWIKVGALPNDPELKSQLIGPTYSFNNRNEILLESKEDMMRRGVSSPDRADAIALTFAYSLAAHANAGREGPKKPAVEFEYDPFEPKTSAQDYNPYQREVA